MFMLIGFNEDLLELRINPVVENMDSTATLLDGIPKYSLASILKCG